MRRQITYETVRVPPDRIFTIDPKGHVRLSSTRRSSSYTELHDLVDHYFAPLRPPPPLRAGAETEGGGGATQPRQPPRASPLRGSPQQPPAPRAYSDTNYWAVPPTYVGVPCSGGSVPGRGRDLTRLARRT